MKILFFLLVILLLYLYGLNLNKLLSHDRNSKNFIDLLSTFNLLQSIFEPTRITNNSQTLIDNIFANSQDSVRGSVVTSALSDHEGQILEVPVFGALGDEPIVTKKRVLCVFAAA